MNKPLTMKPPAKQQAVPSTKPASANALPALIKLCAQVKRWVQLTEILGKENKQNSLVYEEQRKKIAALTRELSDAVAGAGTAQFDELGHYLFHNVQDDVLHPLTELLHQNHMTSLGIANTMQISLAYNRLKFERQDAFRKQQYQHHLESLLSENGAPKLPLVQIHDGWAIDTSMSLPFLDQVLKDSDAIIAERGGVRYMSKGAYRSYFQDIWTDADVERFPSFLNFAASSEVLAVVSEYLKCIPVLSTTLPPGIRFVESNAAYDDQPDKPHDSQLFHVDYYSKTNMYIIVLLRDVTIESGPFCFLPKSISEKVAKAVNCWGRGPTYRFPDEAIYAAAKKEDVIEFSYPRGSVLFIESSGCFHYGSRNSVIPRYQLMIGYTSATRTDMSECCVKRRLFNAKPGDSRLRKMLLDKDYLE